MLIAKFLREVNAELERLQTARNTIAAILATRPKGFEVALEMPASPQDVSAGDAADNADAVTIVDPAPEPFLQAAPAQRRGRPRGSVNRFPRTTRVRTQQPHEPSALTSAVVRGPVFVSAAELERQRRQPIVMAAPAPVVQPKMHEGTLESLIREVQERRASAAA